MKRIIMIVMVLFSICSIAYAKMSIDEIEREVLLPYGGHNTPTRTCVERAREAEKLLTENGYIWRECVKDVFKSGGKHMYVEVKNPDGPSIIYSIISLGQMTGEWIPILDVWSI